jgi:hypothetical protein
MYSSVYCWGELFPIFIICVVFDVVVQCQIVQLHIQCGNKNLDFEFLEIGYANHQMIGIPNNLNVFGKSQQ